MPKISQKKLASLLFTALFVLIVVFLDPKGDVLQSFDKNYKKSSYFDNCVQNNATSSPYFDVAEVADGDTVTINNNCSPESVRLIGIDTPETVDPRKPVQCFGKEASDYTKEHLLGKRILLETDPSEGERDKYGRLLGYIILEDGTNFNKRLIEEGYAHEYTYNGGKYKYQAEFKEAERVAKENQKGLWGEVCAGK